MAIPSWVVGDSAEPPVRAVRAHGAARVLGGGSLGVAPGRLSARARQARRKRSTASTRRCSCRSAGRPSFVKTLETCFSHAAQRDLHPLGDGLVGEALGDQLEHLALARGQRLQRPVVAGAREQAGHDLGVERRAAVGDALAARRRSRRRRRRGP